MIAEGESYLVGGGIIVSINGVNVVDSDALARYLGENLVAGQSRRVGLVRSGASIMVKVTFGTQQ